MENKTYEFFTEEFSKLIQAETMNLAFEEYSKWADEPDDMDLIAIVEHDRGYESFIAGEELEKPSQIELI